MAQLLLDSAGAEGAATQPPPAIAGNDVAGEALKVFISYSHADRIVADALVEALEKNGFSVIIDRRDLPYGEEWQGELAAFIAQSDTVVWLVSPASVKSKWCNWELGEVVRLSKRLVPVRVRDIDPGVLPESLGKIHLLPVEGAYVPSAHEADLVGALNTDRAWLKQATGLGERAREWSGKSRDGALQLRGRALTEAEAWSQTRPRGEAPAPASEILELILASRRAQDRRRRMTVAGSIAAAIVAFVLAAAAVWFGLEAQEQAAEAERQRNAAQENERRAQEERTAALSAEASRMASLALPHLSNGRPDIAMAMALDVAPRSASDDIPFSPELENVLRRAYEQTPAPIERRAVDNAYRLATSPDGGLVAVGTAGNAKGIVQIFDAVTLKERVRFQAIDEEVMNLEFSPDGRSIAVGGGNRAAGIWDVETGALRLELPLPEGSYKFTKMVRFSPDGSFIVVSTAGNAALVFDAATGELKHILPGPDFDEMVERIAEKIDGARDPIRMSMGEMQFSMFGAAMDVAISADSELIAVTGASNLDGAVNVFNARDGTLRRLLIGDEASVVPASHSTGDVLAFSPDGKTLFASPRPERLNAWDLDSGALRMASPIRNTTTFAVSADGRVLVSGHQGGAIGIHCVEGSQETVTVAAHTDTVEWIVADDERKLMVSASADGTAKVWRLPSWSDVCDVATGEETEALAAMKPLLVLAGSRSPVFRAAFSSDGKNVFTVSQDGVLRAWPLPARLDPLLLYVGDNTVDPEDRARDIVVTEDGGKVFVNVRDAMSYDVFSVDVRSGEATRIEDVNAIAPSGPGDAPRFFHRFDQYWTDGADYEINRTFDTWSGPVSRDGRRAVRVERKDARFDDGVPVLIDVESGKDLAALQVGDRAAYEYEVHFSRDGRLLFALVETGDGESGDQLGIWDARDGTMKALSSPIEGYSLVFNHHFSDDGSVILLEEDTQAYLFRLVGDALEPIAVRGGPRASGARALSADGSLVVEPRRDGTIALIRTDGENTPEMVRRLGDKAISFVAISPDNRYVAAVDLANTLTIHSIETAITPVSAQLMAKVHDVRFLPDGKTVFVVDVDGYVWIAPLSPGSEVSDDPFVFVDWLRASRRSLVSAGDRATFGLRSADKRNRPDLENLPVFAVPARMENAAPNGDAVKCDRLAANRFDHNHRGPGVTFDALDARAALPVCARALEQSADDPQTLYQVARIHDKLGNAQQAVDGYLLAAEKNYAAAMRGIARLINLDKSGDLKAPHDAAYWTDRAAEAGDPWSLAARATDIVARAKLGQGIGEALTLLEAAGVPNRAQAAMTLASRLPELGQDPAILERAHFVALLGWELSETMADPNPFDDSQVMRWTTDFLRDRARQMPPDDLVSLYRRVRDWMAAMGHAAGTP